MKLDNIERKLTQLADTNNEYMAFASYHLWYLIDKFHFIIEDIKTLTVFTKHTEFGAFTNEFSIQRWKYLADNLNPKNNFFKISSNGSYGYDAMNTENYSKSFVQNTDRANTSKRSDKFRNIRQLTDDYYQVDMESDKFKCDTCIQQAFFTLDNAKYWFLVFVYEFMYKCMDMNRIHFIEGDTDSMYFAIAGYTNDEYYEIDKGLIGPRIPNRQGFQAVVTDKEYYDEHVFKFLPYDTFCFKESARPTIPTMIDYLLDNSHPASYLSLANSLFPDQIDSDKFRNDLKTLSKTKLNDNLKQMLKQNLPKLEGFVKMAHTKKMLGLAIENQGDNMIALGPKCYTSWNNDGKKLSLKNKGVDIKQNSHITCNSYIEILTEQNICTGKNSTLQMKNGEMSRLTINKIALTGSNNKGVTLENGCVLPFVLGAEYIE